MPDGVVLSVGHVQAIRGRVVADALRAMEGSLVEAPIPQACMQSLSHSNVFVEAKSVPHISSSCTATR